jgi:uncharacterized glyoxalase superfamily protein PhnB
LRDNKEMLTHDLSFYKKLFGKEPRSKLRLGDEFWEEDEKVSKDDNEILEAELSEEEILTAIKGSYAEGGGQALMAPPFYFTRSFGLLLKVT